ncbi:MULTISPECIES: endo-beta-N-acetylglucosaminidase [Streptococcus]|uniref:Endo-beta-N-acetylglucosaminidase n=1 Tax=Streptococcus pseudopneumoniae TaxID=257758 RepID=A0ABX9P9R2_9STRE|nr:MULTISPECIES: endo-beta-N-acetylglucosaminidase [Streptococcus]RJQ60211.1 endo-beta-N-acetylglucosaminidase [Streptococcus pseudopneumoniae]RJY11463.1 endo-beta-N-acetylglucosaminidase [Streptococcus pseudopneumoniae]
MNKKKLLVCALALSTVGVLSTIDTAGVLPFSSQFVSAQERVERRDLTAEEKAIDIRAEVVDDDLLVLKVTPKENFKGFLRGGKTSLLPVVHNADTGEVVWAYKGPEYGSIEKGKGFEDKWVVPRRRTKNGSEKIPDGRYYIRLSAPNAWSLKSSVLGNSNVFTVKNGKFVKDENGSATQPVESSKSIETKQPVASTAASSSRNSVEIPKSNQNSKSNPNGIQSGWSGSSYYQDGSKVISKWIFDKNYNSYFYLDASGNYVQNAWVGNYYLKSGGYMAKSEWIFDKNYGAYYYLTSEGSYSYSTWVDSYYVKSNGKMAKSEWIFDKNYDSYYYLTSEGSYARNTWVGDYYLKSNGKMAVNERTPDGYQVDESGKWVK